MSEQSTKLMDGGKEVILVWLSGAHKMKHVRVEVRKVLCSMKIIEGDANTVMENILHRNIMHMKGYMLSVTV